MASRTEARKTGNSACRKPRGYNAAFQATKPAMNQTKRNQVETVERRGSIQVIARAAAILRALEGETKGLTLGQIAQKVQLARSTVQRIVDALSAEQLLIPATPTAGVRLGPTLVRLASSAAVEFDQIIRPLITGLSQSLGETVDLSVLKRDLAVFTDQIQGAHRLRAVSAVGDTFPLHCTANGKAMLSLLPQDRIDYLLSRPLTRFTDNTTTKQAALLSQIKTCQRTHVAFDREEYTEGICAVGTAFTDPVGRIAAISIPVPTTRFKRIERLIIDKLLEARGEVLSLFGPSAAQ